MKRKDFCIICGIKVITNVDSTCGDPECRKKAHELFHRMILESGQDAETGYSYQSFV